MAIIIYIILLVLLCAAGIGMILLKKKKWDERIQNCTYKVEASVTELLERRSTRSGMFYKPIYTYIEDGREKKIESALFSGLSSHWVGEEVTLLINPQNPQQFIYEDDNMNTGKRVDFMAGLLPFIMAVIVLFLLITEIIG